MAPKSKRSDDFIASDDEDDFEAASDDEVKQRKKAKAPAKKVTARKSASPDKKPAAKKIKRATSDSGDEDDDEEGDGDDDGMLKNEQGDSYALLGSSRRITVRKYKGSILVDIREMYEKDGVDMPGKKGISLNLAQFRKLQASLSLVDNAIESLS